MKARWYLVQLDKEFTLEIKPLFAENGKYYCIFLPNHPEINVKAINSVGYGRIGTVTALARKQEKMSMVTGS